MVCGKRACGESAVGVSARPHHGALDGTRRRAVQGRVESRVESRGRESKMRGASVLVAMLAMPWMVHGQTSGQPTGASGVVQAPAQVKPGGPQAALLTLREALRLSLENNLDIQLARYEPAIADDRVDEATGAYDPLLFGSYTRNHEEDPVSSAFAIFGGTTRVTEDRWSWDTGMSGVLPLGLEYSSQYEFDKIKSDSPITGLRPEYNARWVTQVSLPLLKDLVTNDLSITVARTRAASDRSHEDFQAELTDLLVATEASYWELAASTANTRVAEKSLQTARELLEQTRVQYEVGVVSRVEVVQAEAGVAQRDFELIAAQNRERRAHDNLLNVVLAPAELVYEERRVVPEKAVFRDYDVDIHVATSKALELRPELASSRKNVEDAELQLTLAENQLLPTFDLIGRYQMDGQSGLDVPPASTTIDRSSGSANDDFFNASGAKSYTLGAEFSIPFGNHTAKATRSQRAIELRRARTLYRRDEQTVILDVRNSVRNLRSSIEGIQAAERNRVAQSETLDAEQERLRLGDSTPFQVLEHEEDLADAERQLIFSLQVHRNAIAGLERAQGTLLDGLNISVEEELSR